MTTENTNTEVPSNEQPNIINDFIKKIKVLYEPTENIKEAELFTTDEICSKISSILPGIEESICEIKTLLEVAGFKYQAIKVEGDFNFYWLMKEK